MGAFVRRLLDRMAAPDTAAGTSGPSTGADLQPSPAFRPASAPRSSPPAMRDLAPGQDQVQVQGGRVACAPEGLLGSRLRRFFLRRSADPSEPPALFIDPAVYTRNR